MADSRLHKLSEAGVSVWVDNLSRETVHDGELAGLIEQDAVVGVTSNPSIFQKALASGEAYDAQLKGLADVDENEAFTQLAMKDVSDACDLLHPVWERTGGKDGYVSIEVDPTLAYETQQTYDQAVRFHKEIDKPNLMVKIPATRLGLPAIEDMLAAGKSINITLIFSLQRYKEVVEAHLRGLERLVAGGGDPSKVASVASFFVSRVDTEADQRLDAVGHPELKGKLAVANAKLAYAHWLEEYSGPRWEYLEGKGATKQRCLWASTSVKNPDYKDTLYVEELIAPETVNTMPNETIEAFQDHGEVKPNSALAGLAEAEALIGELAAVGVDYDDVVLTLEEEGVQKFADAFTGLLDGIRAKRAQLVAA